MSLDAVAVVGFFLAVIALAVATTRPSKGELRDSEARRATLSRQLDVLAQQVSLLERHEWPHHWPRTWDEHIKSLAREVKREPEPPPIRVRCEHCDGPHRSEKTSEKARRPQP